MCETFKKYMQMKETTKENRQRNPIQTINLYTKFHQQMERKCQIEEIFVVKH